jgi:hypothetical protein
MILLARQRAQGSQRIVDRRQQVMQQQPVRHQRIDGAGGIGAAGGLLAELVQPVFQLLRRRG